MVELALAMPIFLLLIFSLIELARTMYILNSLNVAAQQVATQIAIRSKRSPSYNISSFSTFADQVRFQGAVVSTNQFSFDVTNAANSSTVTNGQADGGASTKVVVTVRFPPPDDPSLKIPVFDPGNLIGVPIFGENGLQLSSSATCFLERSRRPTLN